jgi:peptide/nickel transport system permease protein
MSRLASFLVRRAAAGLTTVLTMITLAFIVFWAIPSQPAAFLYTAHCCNAYQAKFGDHVLGVDRPKIAIYGDYLWHLVHGDLGGQWTGVQVSAQQTAILQPLGPQLRSELSVTLSLVAGGALLVLLLALPLGSIAAHRLGSLSDRTISLVALIGVCTHPMVVGLMVRSLFGHRLHWAPANGYCPLFGRAPFGCGGVEGWASHLALPWVTFALLFLALYIRMIRVSVAETLPEDYVRTARAKGASEIAVIRRHVLPNAGLRVLTMIGMEIGTVIGVSIYIETAFGLEGLGRAGVFAMYSLDLPQILGIVTIVSLIVVIGNLVVDTLYVVLDPRVTLRPPRARAKSLAGGVI